jgi:hypothetical protein
MATISAIPSEIGRITVRGQPNPISSNKPGMVIPLMQKAEVRRLWSEASPEQKA